MRENKCVFCGLALEDIRGLSYKKYQNKYAHWECFDFLKEKSKKIRDNGKVLSIRSILKLFDEFAISRDLIYDKSHARRINK
jgi:hypothetical protein